MLPPCVPARRLHRLRIALAPAQPRASGVARHERGGRRRTCSELAETEGFALGVHETPRHWLVYAKSRETIRGLLAALGAHGAELRLEEEGVFAWAREEANRLANADAGNLRRQAAASARHTDAIELLGGPDAPAAGAAQRRRAAPAPAGRHAGRAGGRGRPASQQVGRRLAPAAHRAARARADEGIWKMRSQMSLHRSTRMRSTHSRRPAGKRRRSAMTASSPGSRVAWSRPCSTPQRSARGCAMLDIGQRARLRRRGAAARGAAGRRRGQRRSDARTRSRPASRHRVLPCRRARPAVRRRGLRRRRRQLPVLHLGRPEVAAAEFARVLRPGGEARAHDLGRPRSGALPGRVPRRHRARPERRRPATSRPGLRSSASPTSRSSTPSCDAQGLAETRVETISFGLRVATTDELWDGILGGTVRIPALIVRQVGGHAAPDPGGVRPRG